MNRNFEFAIIFEENQRLKAEIEFLSNENSRLQQKFDDHVKSARRKVSILKNFFNELADDYRRLRFQSKLTGKALTSLTQKHEKLEKFAFRRYKRLCSFCSKKKSLALPCGCRKCKECFYTITDDNSGTCFHFDEEIIH